MLYVLHITRPDNEICDEYSVMIWINIGSYRRYDKVNKIVINI